MKDMVFPTLNIAILGGTRLSELLSFTMAGLGHLVFFGVSQQERRNYLLLERHSNITLAGIEEAAKESEVILLAGAPEKARELAYYIDDVKEKVVIDMTSFIGLRSDNTVNTLKAIKTITGSEQVVKCYGAIRNYEFSHTFSGDNIQELFVAGDNKKSKIVADILFQEMGMKLCYDIGNDDTAKMLDEILISDINKLRQVR